MVANFRILSIDTNSVLLANPSSITHTLRQKIGRSDKTVDGQKLTNVRFEVIENFKNPVAVNGETVADTGSIRLAISGSTLSKDVIIKRWEQFKLNTDALIANGSLEGFLMSPDVALAVDAEVTP
ncbi:coat protein [ssRNA phage SRR5995670_1]|uniref:Coat protein n=1 Tax=ssRNA phage SRR5995670_1 TaxID=2786478 RepID=A0A8S5L5R0_9VIRU|nr:coat protein [ssRNA phage SRR5995670_1]DAD52829.1 TPA_asm: coat protein [ssRNA phage SRR5995670_1]